MKEQPADSSSANFARRDLIKLGTGVVTTTFGKQGSAAKNAEKNSAEGQGEFSHPQAVVMRTGAGWKNNANRASGNGPIDDTTRKLVSYVSSMSEARLTEP